MTEAQVPIACSLTEPAARSQLEEWRDLLVALVAATERMSPTELSFHLNEDLGRLEEIVRLAQREKACCAFFDFSILIGAGGVTLRVSVAPGAAAILDDFARLRA